MNPPLGPSSLSDFHHSPVRGGGLQFRIIFSAAFLLASAICLAAQTGTNAFGPYRAIPTESWPECVAIGDFNNDGRNDVVLGFDSYGTSINNQTLLVFLQTLTGGLAEPVRYPAGGDVSAIVTGDFNGDGRTDIAVGRLNPGIRIFYQGASGKFDSYFDAPSGNSRWLCTADFNHDGRADLAGISWSSGLVEVLFQTEAGTMITGGTFPAPYDGFNDLEAGDVSNDGLADIVVMSGQGAQTFSVLKQIPGGFAAPVTYNGGAYGLAIGELNGDGRLDVALGVSFPTTKMVFWLQQGNGMLSTGSSNACDANPEPVEIADINQDGLDDVLTLHGGGSRLGVYFQTSPGIFTTEAFSTLPYASHYNSRGLAVGDITGDGMPDVVVADYNHGLVVLTNRLTRPIRRLTNMEDDSGTARFRLNGRTGYRYAIDISSDLITWIPYRTNIIEVGDSIWIEDPGLREQPQRFYRARELEFVGSNNDFFNNRISIPSSGGTVQGSSVLATKEPGEPNHGGDAGGKSLWWTWTPSFSGIVAISTDGSSFDTTLGVYRGLSFSTLVLVADDDDGGDGRHSRVLINATAGVTYQIAVDGYQGDSGNVTLSVRPAVSNDAFANSWFMSGFEDQVIGVNIGATRETGEPFHWPGAGGASVWWTWRAPSSAWVIVSTYNSDFDTVLAAYTGTSVSGLTLIASNDDYSEFDSTSEIEFFALEGVSYHFAVDGYGPSRGMIMLSLQQ